MSFQEKLTGLFTGPSDSPQNADTPWYLRYGARGLGIFGAFFCILFGFWNCLSITLNVMSILSGLVQILLGICVMAIEAPVCCMFLDFAQTVAKQIESRPPWNRAAAYCGFAIIPIIMYPGLASIFGCGLVFGTGILYGMMALGKKASREEMAANAANGMEQGQGSMEDPDVWRPT